MRLDTQVGLGPGHTVLDGDPAPPPPNGHSHPIFGPRLLWPNGRPSQLLLITCLFLVSSLLFLFGSVRQIKLAIRQLLGAR